MLAGMIDASEKPASLPMDRSKLPTSWSRKAAGPGSAPGAKPPGDKRMNIPPRRAWWTFLALLLVNYLLMRALFPGDDNAVPVPYTAFKDEVAKGNVQAIYSQGASIEGRFKSAVTWPAPGSAAAAAAASAPRGLGALLPNPEPRPATSFTTTLPVLANLNELARLGITVMMSDFAIGKLTSPMSRNGWPKA